MDEIEKIDSIRESKSDLLELQKKIRELLIDFEASHEFKIDDIHLIHVESNISGPKKLVGVDIKYSIA